MKVAEEDSHSLRLQKSSSIRSHTCLLMIMTIQRQSLLVCKELYPEFCTRLLDPTPLPVP
jgi:hypothetical protein